jgi:hypothetical protein
MATNYYDDEDDDFTPEESGDAMKQLRKVNRTLEKRLKELEQEATAAKNAVRGRTIKDVLSSKGINSKVAAFIPQDIEPTEEAVSAWLSEYGDVFGVNNKQGETAEQTKAAPSADLQANQRINNVVNSGTAPAPDEDALAKILNASSVEELNAILGIQAI